MRIITQWGNEADMTSFGITQGENKWAVIGQNNIPAVYPLSYNQVFTIGVYGDKITAFAILSRLLQHKGEEPFRMPPEDTVMDL